MICPTCAIECEKHEDKIQKTGIEEPFKFIYYTCPNCYGIFESKEQEYE